MTTYLSLSVLTTDLSISSEPGYTAREPGDLPTLMARFAALYFGYEGPHARGPINVRGTADAGCLSTEVKRTAGSHEVDKYPVRRVV